MSKQGYVYILASKRNGTLYIGVTSNLQQRVWQHKEKLVDGFTKKYDVDRLVYFGDARRDVRSHRAGEAVEEVEAKVEVGID